MAFSLAAQRSQCISGLRSSPQCISGLRSVGATSAPCSCCNGIRRCCAQRAAVRASAASVGSSDGARVTTRPLWLPGSTPPAHLNGSLPGDFGFDPIGLGTDPAKLAWFAESERVHCRWAMLGVAGVLGQEIFRPDVFWYDAPIVVQNDLPFGIVGLVAFELFAMHWVESKRVQDFFVPGSADQDPVFPGNKLKQHEVGYPGFNVFQPDSMAEWKVKEIKNGRLAMLAFIGFTMAGQVTGLNPLAALSEHLADPLGTTVFSKAAIIPGQAVGLPCKIEPVHNFLGANIPTPCFANNLWP